MTTPNYVPYTVIELAPYGAHSRKVPKFCSMARVHTSPMGLDGRYETYPTPHDFQATYNETDGPGAMCSACLLCLGPNELRQYHDACYDYVPVSSS